MFSTSFAHYLSYGASDQQTARELTGQYDGLVVPGTVASFHRDGTGGFVLSLSALPSSPAYVIDPRTPLFQQLLPKVKSAHSSLAEVLGRPELATDTRHPQPADFTPAVIDAVAKAWADFNRSYQSANNKKFDKYAARLGEDVFERDAKGPEAILPPYFMSGAPADPWWSVSKQAFDATRRHANGLPCTRVVAAIDVSALASLVLDVDDPHVVIWVSDFREADRLTPALVAYARAIQTCTDQGRSLFALYGGFFSVLMAAFGLAGSSHGIGFSEHRAWEELPSSGAPPARFYVPRLHRFIQPDEADLLHDADPQLVQCDCVECVGLSPLELDYHQLMKHSVSCRAAEIRDFAHLDAAAMAQLLRDQTEDFYQRLRFAGLPGRFEARMQRYRPTLERWQETLRTA